MYARQVIYVVCDHWSCERIATSSSLKAGQAAHIVLLDLVAAGTRPGTLHRLLLHCTKRTLFFVNEIQVFTLHSIQISVTAAVVVVVFALHWLRLVCLPAWSHSLLL